ncbi:hypothetical protein DMNBHIDG_00207 [Candidatus Methanoperedenaceae archaeon GB37]|nr:hypothetical protein DMNBHIDG_00207 [Candidatus Methanoperedenaceae archaeon GB37]
MRVMKFFIDTKEMPWKIDPNPVISAIVDDLRRGVSRGIICGKFHKGNSKYLS